MLQIKIIDFRSYIGDSDGKVHSLNRNMYITYYPYEIYLQNQLNQNMLAQHMSRSILTYQREATDSCSNSGLIGSIKNIFGF